jgi:hypothetical protein
MNNIICTNIMIMNMWGDSLACYQDLHQTKMQGATQYNDHCAIMVSGHIRYNAKISQDTIDNVKTWISKATSQVYVWWQITIDT